MARPFSAAIKVEFYVLRLAERGQPLPKNAVIAEECRCHERTVQDVLNAMEDAGKITTRRGNGHERIVARVAVPPQIRRRREMHPSSQVEKTRGLQRIRGRMIA